ncbi:hypothetical protein QH31_003543 [Salmonella enterica subsp. enterica]|nr:hypothetical protein [Salmonella enterica subsp. enterica]EDV0773781.1 hypothetical protein [Salmonella enterica subsp. enterica]EGI6200470.1 hypothetical protein [Salmonella enterica subsp. enterica serovar Eastbourne]
MTPKTKVKVEGQTTLNNSFLRIQATLDDAGLASVLTEWCVSFPGILS